ncbi:MAG TPA: hypothetical protein VJU13_00865 [Candidatus Nitrosocosmicus sp.]|jgi:hypothetical protein|nr:hypothetical protein [Candidatus Nitrosocosmicus sp.]
MPNKQVKRDKQEKPLAKIEILKKAKKKVSDISQCDNLSIAEIDALHYHYSKISPLFKNAPHPTFLVLRILERYIQIDNIVIGDVINEIKQRGLDVSHTDSQVDALVNELALNNKKYKTKSSD